MKKIRMTVSGRVQGVGFRFMTKLEADKLNIHGYVKNQDDGSVYLEAIGDEKDINHFIETIKNSPSPSGRVDSYQLEEDNGIKDSSSFQVR